jgi:probable DNA metabolism protein
MTVVGEHDFEAWRASARRLLAAGVPPGDVTWLAVDRAQDVLPLDDAPDDLPAVPSRDRVPARFVAAARAVVLHRDETTWALLYRLLWRLTHEDRHLLDFAVDDDVRRFTLMEQEVRRDAHKMHAFVRFRRIADADGERYVAWYRPDHHIVALTADFFVDRFRSQRWSILTPDRSAHWDGATLTFGPGLPREAAPADDEMEALWRTYYASVFNPARLNLKAMRAEMPQRHWATLPEAQLLPALVAAAPQRVRGMLDERAPAPTARPFVPDSVDLEVLRHAAAACTGCALHARATQTVFGEGPARSPLLLVGEQPGDQEDRQGAPFVGPAGDVLMRALAAAGLARGDVYLTNAVKHFSWEPRGKRRIHQTPRYSEIRACRPWVEAEIAAVAPRLIVCLGATAAKALLGPQFRITKERGRILDSPWGAPALATWHPSAVLRADDPAHAEELMVQLIADLSLAARHVQAGSEEG